MFHLAAAPARLSRFLTGALLSADRTPRGETFAIGLGCDGWKPRRPLS